jgi:hypothetical protein
MAKKIIKCRVAGIDDHGAGGIATTIMARPTMLTLQIVVLRTGIPASGRRGRRFSTDTRS